MPLIVAFVVSLGSFFGYVAVDQNVPQNAVKYVQQPVRHHNTPYLALGKSHGK